MFGKIVIHFSLISFSWYNISMRNWSVDVKKLKKYPEKHTLWRLEQLINYGLDEEKLDKKEVKRLWPKIEDNLDPYKKRFLEYLLWGKLYSLPNNLTFWNLSKKNNR
jgi:hypothetical protein